MVPVIASSLIEVCAALRTRISESCRRNLSKTFGAWLLQEPEQRAELALIAAQAAKREGADQDFQTIAILGFAAEVGLLSEAQTIVLRKGLIRLASRSPVVNGVPMAFRADAVGILGVALGTKTIADADVTSTIARWVTTFLRDSHEMNRAQDWQRSLFAFADTELGSPLRLSMPKSRDTADVRIALRARGLIDPSTETHLEEDAVRTLEMGIQDLPEGLDCDRIALRLAAFEYVSRVGTSGPASKAVPQGYGAPSKKPEHPTEISDEIMEEANGVPGSVGPTKADDKAARAARRQAVVNPVLQEKRWKRGRLVTEAGVGKNSVYQYLDGTRSKITDENREALADALGLTVEQLPD